MLTLLCHNSNAMCRFFSRVVNGTKHLFNAWKLCWGISCRNSTNQSKFCIYLSIYLHSTHKWESPDDICIIQSVTFFFFNDVKEKKKNDKSIGSMSLFDEFVQRLLETKSKNVTQNDILIFSIWNSEHVEMPEVQEDRGGGGWMGCIINMLDNWFVFNLMAKRKIVEWYMTVISHSAHLDVLLSAYTPSSPKLHSY